MTKFLIPLSGEYSYLSMVLPYYVGLSQNGIPSLNHGIPPKGNFSLLIIRRNRIRAIIFFEEFLKSS